VFNQVKYVDMFYLLLESLISYGIKDDTDIFVYTSTRFMNLIQNKFPHVKLQFEINDTYTSVDSACRARLDLFDLESTKQYNKILYLDTDIIVKDNLSQVFDLCVNDTLYVLEEGAIDDPHDYWGKTLFGNDLDKYKDRGAFTSGILLFNNCEKIKELFEKINKDIIKFPHPFHDQPYIVYNTFKYNLYEKKLGLVAVNNDHNIHSNKIIHHFPGGPGVYQHKIIYMTNFLNKLKNLNTLNNKI
jgi:lipopolysaccharide biosynthesis glycosyltransferase